MRYLGYFGMEFEKAIIIFEISTRRICQNAKFHVKRKNFAIAIKNALLGWNLRNLLPYLKLTT